MGSVLIVVVIVGVVVAATAVAVRGGTKPATAWEPTHRGDDDVRVPVAEWEPLAEPDGASDAEPEPPRSFVHRLRAAGLLGLAVVVLGAGAAALLGLTVLLAARAIDGALG